MNKDTITNINEKLINIFSFTDKLWKAYKTKHNELEYVIDALSGMVPVAEKAVIKQDKKKDCTKEVKTILDQVMSIINKHEEKVNVSNLDSELEKLVDIQSKWMEKLKQETLEEQQNENRSELVENMGKVLDDYNFKKKLSERAKIETLDKPIGEDRYFVSTQEAFRNIKDDDDENYGNVEIVGESKGSRKITKQLLKTGLEDSKLQLCGDPIGDKDDKYWSQCPNKDKQNNKCRVKPTIDVKFEDGVTKSVRVINTDGFCVKDKKDKSTRSIQRGGKFKSKRKRRKNRKRTKKNKHN